ncbi:hypothetical protein ANCCEY_08903 [Ancylostoma ceylanicum]|uniref:Calpain catalytic domain-containing protein n=1 Tax=Ancylostoma ceylanicum TaxID=53326 RepID=A0A0D6LPR0_9BILA|nr:hypothetical protein ANCCEY_08903 [Ancylostoma ceylanicum]
MQRCSENLPSFVVIVTTIINHRQRKFGSGLYGCYENLVGGHLSDALQDVSGGVAETVNVAKFLKTGGPDSPDQLFNNMKEAFDNEALIVAAIAANTKDEIEQTLDCGLVKGHAYAVTANSQFVSYLTNFADNSNKLEMSTINGVVL